MSPGGKKNVSTELERCVSCFRDHSKSSSLQELPEVIPWSPTVCLCTHTRAHTCASRGRGAVSASTSGQPAGESPFLDTDALFQEQALTSACDCLVGLSS